MHEDWEDSWPILGVSWDDAMAYVRWKNARAPPGVVYALPNKLEWQAAGHAASPRTYPFGNRFRPKWMKSCYARPKAFPEPVMRFPIDESPAGVYDLCGSAMEWADDWYDEARNLRLINGGAWGQANPKLFELWGSGRLPHHASGEYGFRLVMRKK